RLLEGYLGSYFSGDYHEKRVVKLGKRNLVKVVEGGGVMEEDGGGGGAVEEEGW
ncbi:hypothetical protein Tco_1443594, partial [Tanacetum coccineum]